MTTRTKTSRRRLRRQARRGMALYMAVIGTALIVSLLGLAGLTVLRIERQQAARSFELLEARALAKAAVELGLNQVNNDPNWRTTYTNGVETAPQLVSSSSSGTVSWILEDTDGSLTDADTELRVRGVGRVGSVVQVSGVRVGEQFNSMDCLRTVAHAAGELEVFRYVSAIGGPFSSNTNFYINSLNVVGDAEAPSYTGLLGDLNGTFSVTGPKQMPPSTVFEDIYLPLATEIDFNSLEIQGTNSILTGSFSASANPTGGPVNPKGVYHVHVPPSGKLKISVFTIVGTLLITADLGAQITDSSSGSWQPHQSDFPVMIVKGASNVSLSLVGAVNEDYRGLIHVIGAGTHTVLGARFNLIGTFVTEGTVTAGHQQGTTLTHDPNLYNNPPQGYKVRSGLAAIPGSWIWDAAP